MIMDLIRSILRQFANVTTLPLTGGVRRGAFFSISLFTLSLFTLHFSLFILSLFTLTSCSSSDDEEDAFPALVTEMSVLRVGTEVTNITLITDSGKSYRVTNEIEGLKPNAWARCLAGYVVQDAGSIEILTLQGVAVLPNSSNMPTLKRDPVGVVSAWMGGGYVNLHLLKKNKGADHAWGYILDNSYANAGGGTTYEVSLYHDQRNDPAAYSTDIYFSLSQDSLSQTRISADSIALTINTFDAAPHQWRFALTP